MKVWVLVFLFAAAYAKHEYYTGWKTYYVAPSTQAQLSAVRDLTDRYELDFLSSPIVEREGMVLVKPEHQAGFTQALQVLEVAYRVHSVDVKVDLELEDELFETRRMESMARNGGRQLPYDYYQEWEVIDEYILEMARRYPERATLVTPGVSFEGRPLRYLKISTTNFEDESKPVIFIDGGIHAREWISPPTVTWSIHKLLENVTEPDLLEKFDWILFPVVNPDGYKFSFTTNRFWSKTRSTDNSDVSYLCPGVDGNRNYGFAWNTISISPCADTYSGNRSFSEVETRAVRDILFEYRDRTALYLTMHSFGSMILYPWGHDGTLSINALNLHMVGVGMVDSIHTAALPSFPRYVVGNSVMVIGYTTAGSAMDYAHSIGVPLTYTYELPGLSGDLQGFQLDSRYIQQVCVETWEGIAAGARRAGDMFEGPIVH